jgi:putative nucleotidyltransferase with HDIG domain
MKLLNSKDTVQIILRTLNLLDARLVDHGARVAYLVYHMLIEQNKYTKEQIQDITMLALLHDIGAFKTEQIEKIIEFETSAGKEHSIYGYLFLKLFSPLGDIADAVLYHHTHYSKHPSIVCNNLEISDIIHLADRIDILLLNGTRFNPDTLQTYSNRYFNQAHIELFCKVNQQNCLFEKFKTKQYQKEFIEISNTFAFTEIQMIEFLNMLTSAIDFRSEFTVAHTIKTVFITIAVAKLLDYDSLHLKKIALGALLHDIGKIATPLRILEKPDKLTDSEMNVMQNHVVVTEESLKDSIDEEIFRIAIRHHEKLDGSGYPHGLCKHELSQAERVVAVSDIVSALTGKRSYKEQFDRAQTISVLQNMADQGKLCPNIVSLVIEHFDEIMRQAQETSEVFLNDHQEIKGQYIELYNQFQKIG